MTDFREKGGAVEFCAVFSRQRTSQRRFGTEFNSLQLGNCWSGEELFLVA